MTPAAAKTKRPRKNRLRKQLTPRKPSARKHRLPKAPTATLSSPPSLSLRLLFSPPSSSADPLPKADSLPASFPIVKEASNASKENRSTNKALAVANKKNGASTRQRKDAEEDVFIPRAKPVATKTPAAHHHHKRKARKPEGERSSSTRLEKPQRCFKCRKMGLPENSLACSKCDLVWHAECLDIPLTFRPAFWTCPLHAPHPKLQTHSQSFKLLPSSAPTERPVVNQAGGFAGLLNLLKEKTKHNPAQVLLPAGIKVPDLVIQHYNNALMNCKK